MDIDASPLPDALATTAYFVISEAVANAIKHASATRIVLRVARVLVFYFFFFFFFFLPTGSRSRFTDDGLCGADPASAPGWPNRVASASRFPGRGQPGGPRTVVRAELPVPHS